MQPTTVSIDREFLDYKPSEGCYGIIYMAVNRLNGKRYIGKTTLGLAKRKAGHKQQSTLKKRHPFYSSIRKHGWEAFDWIVVDECYSKEELNASEVMWIKLSRQMFGVDKCYNIAEGGGSDGGWNHTDEARAAISKAAMGNKRCVGRVASNETRAKQSKAAMGNKGNTGKKFCNSHREGIAKGQKASWTLERRKAQAERMRGNNHGHKTKGRAKTDEEKARIKATLTGRKLSPKHRAAISKGLEGNNYKRASLKRPPKGQKSLF